jgi:hypothetical protein
MAAAANYPFRDDRRPTCLLRTRSGKAERPIIRSFNEMTGYCWGLFGSLPVSRCLLDFWERFSGASFIRYLPIRPAILGLAIVSSR